MPRQTQPLQETDANIHKHSNVDQKSSSKPTAKKNAPRKRTSKNYDNLKVTELKNELRKRSLPRSGLRADLIKRLYAADGRPVPSDGQISVKAPPKNTSLTRMMKQCARQREFEESTDPITVCLRQGPGGPPVFDEHGFELDYEAVRKCSYRHARPSFKKMEKWAEEWKERAKRKSEILKMSESQLRYFVDDCIRDRIAKDLGFQYHQVGMAALEEWDRRGFCLEPNFAHDLSEAEKDRLKNLMTGCALRKGYDDTWR
ncbi:hypothetical protein MMC18_002908 [Xylographa bjoerkii]|nr:hypothetical protein [Xylographa bjoerkii]